MFLEALLEANDELALLEEDHGKII